MSITLTRTGLAVAVVAGLVTVGAASTVSYAAGSTAAGVTACANSKGRLALVTSKNKCAKGFTKVTIAKQGPRGATGATGMTGATGKTGAQGPGARSYRDVLVGTGNATSVTVAGFTYKGTCSVSGGSGDSRVVTTSIVVTAPSGKYVSLDGTSLGGPDNNLVATGVDTLSSSSASASVLANGSQNSHARMTLLVKSNTGNQLLTIKLSAFPADSILIVPPRCAFDGVITPAA